ncbi:maleylpyruvate isomerase N-terminal domain-containing protein [Brachybacterium sp. MASK1Z-5]|uniref:Maleylpyruvate isomerase N-terminal domain-containing protein n=1 Tax=Brachybacterium halotolerans TaxID=2795215 RepID=A0ABS1B860_9MICO|nr:maleylpyruvate isomerase N-terminal domain-containing protein [Brachybacterium halotolerans]
MGRTAAPGRDAQIEAFLEAWSGLRRAVDALPAEAFAHPSGCRGWLVRDLVCHLVIDVQDVLITLATPAGTGAGVRPRPGRAPRRQPGRAARRRPTRSCSVPRTLRATGASWMRRRARTRLMRSSPASPRLTRIPPRSSSTSTTWGPPPREQCGTPIRTDSSRLRAWC